MSEAKANDEIAYGVSLAGFKLFMMIGAMLGWSIMIVAAFVLTRCAISIVKSHEQFTANFDASMALFDACEEQYQLETDSQVRLALAQACSKAQHRLDKKFKDRN